MKCSAFGETDRFARQVIVKTWRAYANQGLGHVIFFATFAESFAHFAVKLLILPLCSQKS